jgi:hypothetical protein
MKSRNSPNLYEILRTASAAKDPHPLGPTPEPAAAVADLPVGTPAPPEPAVEVRPSPPSHRRIAVTHPPTRPLEPAASPEPASGDPGEKALRVTYNALLFAGLVALGVVFLAYTLGVRSGRAQADAAAAPAPEPEASAPAAPPEAPRKFTIQLIEYRARNAEERTKALAAATTFKNGLERAGYKGARVDLVGVAPDQRVVLRYGEFADAAAPQAQETLRKLAGLKFAAKAREPEFARTARFVAAP